VGGAAAKGSHALARQGLRAAASLGLLPVHGGIDGDGGGDGDAANGVGGSAADGAAAAGGNVATATAAPAAALSSSRVSDPGAYHAAKQRRQWRKVATHLQLPSATSAALGLWGSLRSFRGGGGNGNGDGATPRALLRHAWQRAPPMVQWPRELRLVAALGVLVLLFAAYGAVDLVLVAASGQHAIDLLARYAAPPLAAQGIQAAGAGV